MTSQIIKQKKNISSNSFNQKINKTKIESKTSNLEKETFGMNKNEFTITEKIKNIQKQNKESEKIKTTYLSNSTHNFSFIIHNYYKVFLKKTIINKLYFK